MPAGAPKAAQQAGAERTPGLRERNKLDKERRIREAARELFIAKGFDDATTREIAQTAGVNLALIHYYFGNKRALFEATVTRRADFLNGHRRDLLSRLPDAATLDQVFECFLRPAVEIRQLPDDVIGGHLHFGNLDLVAIDDGHNLVVLYLLGPGAERHGGAKKAR